MPVLNRLLISSSTLPLSKVFPVVFYVSRFNSSNLSHSLSDFVANRVKIIVAERRREEYQETETLDFACFLMLFLFSPYEATKKAIHTETGANDHRNSAQRTT